jgi:hypothetical protein
MSVVYRGTKASLSGVTGNTVDQASNKLDFRGMREVV